MTKNFVVAEQRKNVKDLVAKINNSTSFLNENAKLFTVDVLDGFNGAKVGSKRNLKSAALEDYCRTIDNKGQSIPRINLCELASVENVRFGDIKDLPSEGFSFNEDLPQSSF